jgi:hypothetical protein
MIAALQKHSGIRSGEDWGIKRAGNRRREGWDSQRDSIQHIAMLDAMESPVKRHYARPEYFNDSAGSHSNRYSRSLYEAKEGRPEARLPA